MQVAQEIPLSEAKARCRRETYNVEAIPDHYRTPRKKGSLVLARAEKKSRGSVTDDAACQRKHVIEGWMKSLTSTLGTCGS